MRFETGLAGKLLPAVAYIALAQISLAPPAWALLRLLEGATYLVQGKVEAGEKAAFLVLNFGSRSQVRLRLSGKIPKGYAEQSGSNAEIIARLVVASPGQEEGEVLEFRRYLKPGEKPRSYGNESDISRK